MQDTPNDPPRGATPGISAPAYGPDSFVSWRNFADADPRTACRSFLIHDVTLRDGEQQAGVVFSSAQRLEIALALASAGVDRIEAGMIGVFEEDNGAIRTLVDMGLGCEIWTIARSIPADVVKAVEIGVDGVGVILLANDQYCRIFGWTPAEAMCNAVEAAAEAVRGDVRTALLVADSSRMQAERLRAIVAAATESKAFGSIALMDTFGALNPRGTAHLVRSVRAMTHLPIEFHAHNDFGLGTANTLAALEAGTDVVHASVIGLGERVGNAPLEEVAAGATLLHGRAHRLDLSRLCELARLVQRCSGVTVAANKAIVGESYSQVESGAVAAEYTRIMEQREDLQWLFPFRPALVGAPDIQLVLGKGSGKANINAALASANLTLPPARLQEVVAAVKQEAARLHRLLTPAEFLALACRAGAATGASRLHQA